MKTKITIFFYIVIWKYWLFRFVSSIPDKQPRAHKKGYENIREISKDQARTYDADISWIDVQLTRVLEDVPGHCEAVVKTLGKRMLRH